MGFMFTLPDVRRCWMSPDSADHTAGKSGSSCQQSMAETLARLALRRFQTPPVFGVFQAFSAFFSILQRNFQDFGGEAMIDVTRLPP